MGVPATIAAIYTTAAAQSIANNTLTIVNFDTKVQDTHNAVTTGAAWKFTAPAGGFYLVDVIVQFAGTTAWADAELGSLRMYVNAALVARPDYKDNYGSASTVYMKLGGSTLVHMNAGDYLDMRVIQTSGAALALLASATQNYISIVKFAGS